MIKIYNNYQLAIGWLIENVGEVLWSRPIIEWRGRGWHIKSGSNFEPFKAYYEVEIEDEKLALIFALKFA